MKKSHDIIDKNIKPLFKKLNDVLAPSYICHYYKYHDIWKFVCQKMTFAITLINYLEFGILASHSDVTNALGSK